MVQKQKYHAIHLVRLWDSNSLGEV